jgi:glutaredoxin 3
MPRVEIYTKHSCAFCHMAKALLARAGLRFEEHNVTSDPQKEKEMRDRSGRRTLPQIFIDGIPIGGYSELSALYTAGKISAHDDSEGAADDRA